MTQLFMRTLSGVQVPIHVLSNCNVADIKRRIQEHVGIDPVEQKLWHDGNELEDGKNLSECNIVNDSIVDLNADMVHPLSEYKS